jgi:SAM-dependent methyltransferase
VVELLADDDRPGGWLLLLDRVRQSYVCLDDPAYLEFPYVQVLAETIDGLPPGPLDVVHLGGGAATLPRWLAATRPGSIQLVFESHAELLDLVRARLPISADSGIDLRWQEARSGVAGLPTDSADAVVIDVFSGGRVPADVSTTEFFGDVARVLRPSGLLLLNATGALGSSYGRRLLATIARHFPEVLAHGGDNGDSVGNLVIAAARGGLPVTARLARDGPMGPPLALSGPALAAYIGTTEPLTDASSMRSPVPPDETWRVGGE